MIIMKQQETVPVLNIKYQLVQNADYRCIPEPVTLSKHGIVYLKTNQNISLAYNNYLKVHTGIILLSYPELVVNTIPNITIEMVAHFHSIPELMEEEGIEVIQPTILTADYDDEIVLTIRNNHKEIFNAEKGEPICIMELGFVPKVNFILNQ